MTTIVRYKVPMGFLDHVVERGFAESYRDNFLWTESLKLWIFR